jgi:beta-galactosidase
MSWRSGRITPPVSKTCPGFAEAVPRRGGFSEGSQPMGIFRPVHLVVTRDLRIAPFGVHIWNDTTVSRLFMETTLRNYSDRSRTLTLVSRLIGGGSVKTTITIPAGQALDLGQRLALSHPHLWSLKDPYLYTLVSQIIENGVVIDKVTTPYGIRWIKWGRAPVFIKRPPGLYQRDRGVRTRAGT